MTDHLPPVSRIPTNCPEHLVGLEVGGYHVGSWCPELDGKGPATQVHFTLLVSAGNYVVLRFRAARAVNELIAALERHRNDVWPGGGA